jgi:hypothetical protein
MRRSLALMTLFTSVALAFAAPATLASSELLRSSALSVLPATPSDSREPRSREVFYTQAPSFDYAVNASTAFESEIADDLPDSLLGRTIGEVTLHVTEWGAPEWMEPAGVVICFYEGKCPPPLEPAVTESFAWNGLMTSLELMNPPVKIVYEVTAALSVPFTVVTDLSIGAYVVTDWAGAPYAGLTLTEPGELHGCGQLYWDSVTHGAPRWTPLSDATGVPADLAYSLAEEGTGLTDEMSWGRIKGLFR